MLRQIDESISFFQVKSKESKMEARYDKLQARVGTTLAFNANMVKLLTFIILFSDDAIAQDPNVDPMELCRIRNIQNNMIGMLKRYLFAKFPATVAKTLSRGILGCVADLREMIWIKKNRPLACPSA